MATKEKKQKVEKKIEVHTVNCSDKNCPIHGNMPTRGREFTGEIIRTNAHRTAVVKWDRLYYIPKYERYEKRSSKVAAHNPECMNLKVGDHVKISECRPISKTKTFVIIERIK